MHASDISVNLPVNETKVRVSRIGFPFFAGRNNCHYNLTQQNGQIQGSVLDSVGPFICGSVQIVVKVTCVSVNFFLVTGFLPIQMSCVFDLDLVLCVLLLLCVSSYNS